MATKETQTLTKPVGSLWQNRNFMLLWVGQSVGSIGPQITLVALPLLALTSLHASTFEVSLLTTFTWLPYLLFSLPAGILVDRYDHRLLMIGCDVSRMLLILSIPLLGLAHLLPLWYLYVAVSVTGTLTVIFTIAYRGQLPKLVSSDQLVEGNAKLGISDSLSELIGPSIGGALVSLIDAVRTMFGGVLTFFVSAVTLTLIRMPKAEPSTSEPRTPLSFASIVRDGLGFVLRERVLRSLLICTAVCNFFLTAIFAIAIPFLKTGLHTSSAVIGVIFALGSVGGIMAGVFASRISRKIGNARLTWLSLFAAGPLFLLMPLAGHGWTVLLYAVGMIAVTASTTLFNVGSITYRQLATPPELLSRVNGSYLWVSYGIIPLGSLFGGALGTWVGLRFTIWVCAIALWSTSLLLAFSPLRKTRDFPLKGQESN